MVLFGGKFFHFQVFETLHTNALWTRGVKRHVCILQKVVQVGDTQRINWKGKDEFVLYFILYFIP